MKVRNLNNSAIKTKKLIKDTFIKLLSQKKEISNITVTELVKMADISRATFYSHYCDIYNVVEDFEEEIINEFFTNSKLLVTDSYEKYFDELFAYLKLNEDNYKMMCRSNDFLFSANKLSILMTNKFLELINNDKTIIKRDFIEAEIGIFINGLIVEYIKYCRKLSSLTLDDLQTYIKLWYKKFMKERAKIQF